MFIWIIAALSLILVGAFLLVRDHRLAGAVCMAFGLCALLYVLYRYVANRQTSTAIPISPLAHLSPSIFNSPSIPSSLAAVSSSFVSDIDPSPLQKNVWKRNIQRIEHSLVTGAARLRFDDANRALTHTVISEANRVSQAIERISTVNGQPDDSVFSQKTLQSIGHAMNQLMLYFAPGKQEPMSAEEMREVLARTREVVLKNKPPRSFFKIATTAALVGGLTLGVGYYASQNEQVTSFVKTLFDTWVLGASSLNAHESSASAQDVSINPSTAFSFPTNVGRLLSMSPVEMKLFWSMKVTQLRDLIPHPANFSLPLFHFFRSSVESIKPIESVSLIEGPLNVLSRPVESMKSGWRAMTTYRSKMKNILLDYVQPGRSDRSSVSSNDELFEVVVGTFVILLVFGTVLYDYFSGGQNSSHVPPQQFGRKNKSKSQSVKKGVKTRTASI